MIMKREGMIKKGSQTNKKKSIEYNDSMNE